MPTTIDRERVRQLINQGAQLVEVLPAVEYVDEHLPGAISIPLNEPIAIASADSTPIARSSSIATTILET